MTAIVVNDRVVLLNADFNPHQVINFKKAANLLARDKAVIVEGDPTRAFGQWIWPKILRLKEYVYVAWEKINGPPKVSKRYVLIRDKHICTYCGEHATTIDHVIPRSKGGPQHWQNLTAACSPCNRRKRNRTPEEAGMPLKYNRKPWIPTRAELREE